MAALFFFLLFWLLLRLFDLACSADKHSPVRKTDVALVKRVQRLERRVVIEGSAGIGGVVEHQPTLRVLHNGHHVALATDPPQARRACSLAA